MQEQETDSARGDGPPDGIDGRLGRVEPDVSWISNRLENVEELTLKTAVRGATEELVAVRRQELLEERRSRRRFSMVTLRDVMARFDGLEARIEGLEAKVGGQRSRHHTPDRSPERADDPHRRGGGLVVGPRGRRHTPDRSRERGGGPPIRAHRRRGRTPVRGARRVATTRSVDAGRMTRPPCCRCWRC